MSTYSKECKSKYAAVTKLTFLSLLGVRHKTKVLILVCRDETQFSLYGHSTCHNRIISPQVLIAKSNSIYSSFLLTNNKSSVCLTVYFCYSIYELLKVKQINFVLQKMAPKLVQVGPLLMTWDEEGDNENEEKSLNSPTTIPTLKPLVDSSGLMNKPDADQLLAKQFEKDGYLFIRGLLDRQSVLEARR